MYCFSPPLHLTWKAGRILLCLLSVACILSACSTTPQASGKKGPVLYAGYLLYQKPVKTPNDYRTTPATLTVAALNANDGTKVWQSTLLNVPPDSESPFGAPSDGPYDLHLTVDGTRLYAVATKEDKGQVTALDARTGNILWTHAEDTEPVYLLLATNGTCYIKVGPMVRNVGPETLKALDGQSGKLLWSVSSGDYRFGHLAVSSKAVYLVQQKFGPNDGQPDIVELRALRLTDGTELWHKEVENTTNQPSLFYTGIDLQADDQAIYLVKIEDKQETTPTGLTGTRIRTIMALHAQDGSPLWSVNDPQNDPPNVLTGANLVLFDQVLYMIAGYHMSVFNAQDGTVLSAFQSSSYSYLWLFAPKDHLYTLNRTGGVCSLNSSDGTQQWCSAITVGYFDGPKVVGTDHLYFLGYQGNESQAAIYVLKQSDGSQVAHYGLAEPKQWGLYAMVFDAERA